jgi:hypothetical protein
MATPAPAVPDEPGAPGTADPLGYLGLDVSQAEVVACLLLADGREPVRRWSIPNTQPGGEALATRVAALAAQHGIRRLRIGLEATNLYWWHLACLLQATPLLGELEREVYALNPKLVHGLKKAYADTGKTDLQDAFFIAERLRIGRLPASFQVDALYAPLQRLTRFRAHLAQTLAREKNYFLSFLFLQFSAFSQQEPFGDPFGATSLAVLESFSTEDLAQASLEELAAFVQQHGRGRFADPQAIAATLTRAVRDSYRLDRVLAEPVTLVLGATMATIRTLQTQLREVDKTIARELAALPPNGAPSPRCPASAPRGPLAWWPRLGISIASTMTRRSPSTPGWSGRLTSRAASRPTTPLWRKPAIATCATTWSRRPTVCGCTAPSTGPTTRPSWLNRPSTPTSGRWS